MFNLLKRATQRWQAWVGDRDMENAIREQMSRDGYFGRSAKFHNVKLVAIQRPGWVQVYRFEATVRVKGSEEADRQWLLGLALDDGRKGTKVRVFTSAQERKAIFAQWSDGFIRLRGSSSLLD